MSCNLPLMLSTICLKRGIYAPSYSCIMQLYDPEKTVPHLKTMYWFDLFISKTPFQKSINYSVQLGEHSDFIFFPITKKIEGNYQYSTNAPIFLRITRGCGTCLKDSSH